MNLVHGHLFAALRTACVLASASGLLTGCATMPDSQQLRASVAPYPGESLPGSRDGRARYRQIFCEMAAPPAESKAWASTCDDLLWRLQDERAPATDSPSLPALAQRLQIFVVSGAFSDCREPATVPFEDAIARLSAQGVRIRPVMVSGRSSAARNARQIADAIAGAAVADDDRVVLVGYSKGAVDALQFLVDFPEQARHVAAVLSVAGAIQGSPLAEQGDWWYRTFLEHAFAGTCDPGDGQVIHSLLPSVRKAWLAEHPLPPHVAYYSLAAFTTGEHIGYATEAGVACARPPRSPQRRAGRGGRRNHSRLNGARIRQRRPLGPRDCTRTTDAALVCPDERPTSAPDRITGGRAALHQRTARACRRLRRRRDRSDTAVTTARPWARTLRGAAVAMCCLAGRLRDASPCPGGGRRNEVRHGDERDVGARCGCRIQGQRIRRRQPRGAVPGTRSGCMRGRRAGRWRRLVRGAAAHAAGRPQVHPHPGPRLQRRRDRTAHRGDY